MSTRLSGLSERQYHRWRWGLTVAWGLLIVSLFADPITPWLTAPEHFWSPLRVDPNACVLVQGRCVDIQPYALGAPVFWGLIVPSSLFILLVFGHEVWRRICPLSFLSQIPRALGWQRQVNRNGMSSKRAEVVRVMADSWLGKHYLKIQLLWFFVGLCLRILVINSDRIALGIWLLLTIGAAMIVGYLYGGKTWCNYFCPMAPVQKIYGEPQGLFTHPAHLSESKITQSMCRTVDADGQEKSACVACQSPCIDIDAERSYWDGVPKSESRLLYYGYVGLVMGYFAYYYLYAGNWDYYFSGVWAYETRVVDHLWDPGFYLWNQEILLPKILAVPLTLGGSAWGAYALGGRVESWLQTQWGSRLSVDQIRHRIYSCCTFFVFNIFFIFAGRSWLTLCPLWIQYLWDTLVIVVSMAWLLRTWGRSRDQYSRESLSSRLRKQLTKIGLDIASYLEGRSLEDLSVDEVHILFKVLPGFTREKRQQAYKGILREALEEGYVNSASSLNVLASMRAEMDIDENQHALIVTELGVEDPRLLDPERLHTLEDSVRLSGYRKALDRLLMLQQRQSLSELMQRDPVAVKRLRQDYCITVQDEEEILGGLAPDADFKRRADYVLEQLRLLIRRLHALNQPQLLPQQRVLLLLLSTLKQQKRLLVRSLLEMIESSRDPELARQLAHDLGTLAPSVLPEVLDNPASEWTQRLSPDALTLLRHPGDTAPSCSLSLGDAEIIDHLQALLTTGTIITQAASLYILQYLDAQIAQRYAHTLSPGTSPRPLLTETLDLVKQGSRHALQDFGQLEKLVYLFSADFFATIHTETLLELSELAYFKQFQRAEIISDEGDTCRELLLLIEGSAQIMQVQRDGVITTRDFLPGELLDELEVLSHTHLSGRITCQVTPTRLLALPVDALDQVLEQDHNFARRILEMESRRLHQLVSRPSTTLASTAS